MLPSLGVVAPNRPKAALNAAAAATDASELVDGPRKQRLRVDGLPFAAKPCPETMCPFGLLDR